MISYQLLEKGVIIYPSFIGKKKSGLREVKKLA